MGLISRVRRTAFVVGWATVMMIAGSCLVARPAAAQYICGQTGIYASSGGSVNITGGGASTLLGSGFACGQNADASGNLSNNAAIGNNASASGVAATNMAIGNNANASGDNGRGLATGSSANASGLLSTNTATGALANASGDLSTNVATGGGANASGDFSGNVAIGANANASGASTTNTAVGTNAVATGTNSSAFGSGSSALGANAIAMGTGASANFNNSAAIGNGATVTRANQQVFGTASNTYTMGGITSTASKAAQSGPTQLVTSDAAGNLATATLGSLGLASTGDINAMNARLDDLSARSNKATTGVAMAFAMAGVPTLMPEERFAVSMNWGTFQSTNGLALNAAARLADHLQFNAGVGYGANQNLFGARAGLRIGW